MDQPAVQYGLFLALLLALSGGLSAAETAIFSLTTNQLGTVAARSPGVGVRLQALLSRPRRTLLTLRVCDTVINLAAAAVALALA
ncbi:MAG: CNNM domain-containing protein, partial [Candidatus Methylomirabilales bacterium]